MLPLIAGGIADIGRPSLDGPRGYAATQGNVETAPVTRPEPGGASRRRRGQNARPRGTLAGPRSPEPHLGQNVDIDV